ncbi:hypothetical protein B4585_08925 [Lacticaseibacillus paracasei]|nr:hypothetical protein B4585_08925 [Lacticaseibacillus paracasei]
MHQSDFLLNQSDVLLLIVTRWRILQALIDFGAKCETADKEKSIVILSLLEYYETNIFRLKTLMLTNKVGISWIT